MNFKEGILKIDMLLNRVHSTESIRSTRLKIKEIIDSGEEILPEVQEDFINMIANYCVSDTEVNSTKQMLTLLSLLDDLIIDPVELVEGENILVAGHFVAYPELLAGYQIGNTVWYYKSNVYPTDPFVRSLTLNKSTTTIEATKTEQLNSTLLPNTAIVKTVTWTSSNTEVATVSSTGLVTALSEGSSTITVTSTDDISKKANCVVNVLPLPTGVSITSPKTSGAIGETIQASATVSPSNAMNKDVTWVSSNPGVATVSSAGLITILSVGTTNITAKTVANNLTSNIISIEGYSVPASITVSPTNSTVEKGKTTTITGTILPANTKDKSITWTSSNTGVATVSTTGVVTGVSIGTSIITAKTFNNISGTSNLTVVAPKVSSVTLNGNTDDFNIGETVNMTIVPTPSDAAPFTTTLTKTAGSGAVTINKVNERSYNVIATADGEVTLSLEVENISEPLTKTFNVLLPEVTGVTLNGNTSTFRQGEQRTLTVTNIPTDTLPYETTLTKTSGTGTVTINKVNDKSYNIIGVNPGTVTLTLSVVGKPSVTTTRTFEVLLPLATSVELNGDTTDFNIDEVVELTVSNTPTNAATYTTTLTKSTGTGEVSIVKNNDKSYSITGVAEGPVTLILNTDGTANNTSTSITFNVLPIPEPEPEPDPEPDPETEP